MENYFSKSSCKNKKKILMLFLGLNQLTEEIKPFYLLPPIQEKSMEKIDPRVTLLQKIFCVRLFHEEVIEEKLKY